MGYAIVTYLSSRFLYGPTRDLGFELASHSIPGGDYRNFLLIGYSEALEKNGKAIRRNSRRFRNTLGQLLNGIVSLFAAGLLIGLEFPFWVEVVITILVAAAILFITGYIQREGYLTIPHEDSDNE